MLAITSQVKERTSEELEKVDKSKITQWSKGLRRHCFSGKLSDVNCHNLIKRCFSSPYRFILALFIALYIVVVGRYCMLQYDRYLNNTFDLGIFDQALWLISHGHTPFLTTRGMHLLGDHFSLILYLMAPLYWLWDDPRALLVFQTIILAIGACPLFLLTEKRLKSSETALIFSIAYLLYPALQGMNASDFHPDAMITPLLLFALWFLDQKNQ